ncbi:band 4.1-like protein 2 isoform X7 [Takifugu rubripes]|uniref:band 4.1-like protein 2 isoform X7 n=1 Tax=Takifugu rubripes TaxID=31033 RepID=UPI001145BEDE|nr:band 4.1-like protein 2 isoform X7 [Takifugu rubripes]
MTTEASSETELKEKAEESAAQTDQSEKASEDTQEVGNAEGEVKEKEKEGKGISRYLPTWLKKQKSQSQTSPTKEAPEKEETQEEEKPTPEVNGHAEEVVEKEPEKSEQAEHKGEESETNASAGTEPTKEEKEKDSAEERPEEPKATREEDAAEAAKREPEAAAEGVQGTGEEGQTSIFQSPLRLVKKGKMKLVVCRVNLLDGTDFTCEVEKRARGQYLFFKVCEHLNLMEKDYFGLTYKDSHEQKCWLDPTKEIKKQICSNNWQFSFNVKFYPPDPSLLTEDITRYLLCLQLRDDVATGRLPCSFVTHSLLGSYTLQAEFGDYEPDQPRPLDHISQCRFAPSQNKEMEEKILELHKSHRGMTPAQADTQFLENAKKLSMYGVDLHHAKDSEGVDIMLGVCANGLLVYKDRLRINRFAWPKILKISYKRNNFYIKIRPGETEQFESTVGFKLQNHRSAKRLWKVCVENHSFFRLNAPEPPPKARFLTLGSKFRYSGRTQAQTRLASSLIDRPAPKFERTSSKRISRSLDGAPVISITDADLAENGRELHSDSKLKELTRSPSDEEAMPTQQSAGVSELAPSQDHDKTQEEVLKHQASISQLKRSFMEAPPPSPPQLNQWEKRLTSSPATIRIQQQQVVSEPQVEAATAAAAADNTLSDTKEPAKTIEVEIEETVVIQEVSKIPKPEGDVVAIGSLSEPGVKTSEPTNVAREESVSSESESEEEAEYHPNVSVSIARTQIPEEKEEELEQGEKKEEKLVEPDTAAPGVTSAPAEVSQPVEATSPEEEGAQSLEKNAEEEKEEEEEKEVVGSDEVPVIPPEEAPNGVTLSAEAATEVPAHTEEEEEPKMNGEASLAEAESRPQVICCSELDGNGDGEPGVLMTAQTITSESLCTTTTTHITKTLKGGLSETRIEKRIVITGDCDIDHDEALAQAIKEAKEQHPDMSVTRVVVHKETELTEEED